MVSTSGRGTWSAFFPEHIGTSREGLDAAPFVTDSDGRIGTRDLGNAPFRFEMLRDAATASMRGLRRLIASREEQPQVARSPAGIAWVEDWDGHTVDPGDGEAPIPFWWGEDASPSEVLTTIQEAFERGTRFVPKGAP